MNEREAMAAKTERIFNELNAVAESNKARMTEEVFLNFLPLFCGETPVNPKITFQVYHSYAGSPYREVTVVDVHNRALFDVPPVVLPAPIDIKRERGQVSMHNVVAMAKMHENRISGSSDLLIAEGIASRLNTDMQDFNQLLDYLRRWNEIFKRYGKPIIDLTGVDGVGEKNTQTPTAAVNDYDDWEPL